MAAARMVAMGEVLAEFTRPCGGTPLDVAVPFEGVPLGSADVPESYSFLTLTASIPCPFQGPKPSNRPTLPGSMLLT